MPNIVCPPEVTNRSDCIDLVKVIRDLDSLQVYQLEPCRGFIDASTEWLCQSDEEIRSLLSKLNAEQAGRCKEMLTKLRDGLHLIENAMVLNEGLFSDDDHYIIDPEEWNF